MLGTCCSKLGFRDGMSLVEGSDGCQSMDRCPAKPPVCRPESLDDELCYLLNLERPSGTAICSGGVGGRWDGGDFNFTWTTACLLR